MYVVDKPLTAYTPTLTSSGTNPTLGTGGTITGRWCKLGALRYFEVSVFFGTSPSAGTGNYLFSLPAVAGAPPFAYGSLLAEAVCVDFSSGNQVGGRCRYYSADLTKTYAIYQSAYPIGAEVVIGATTPWTWAASDSIQIRGFYIPA